MISLSPPVAGNGVVLGAFWDAGDEVPQVRESTIQELSQDSRARYPHALGDVHQVVELLSREADG